MPYGREGTNFIISFTPVEYGKIRKGKLIIQTDDMYWYYKIINSIGLILLKEYYQDMFHLKLNNL